MKHFLSSKKILYTIVVFVLSCYTILMPLAPVVGAEHFNSEQLQALNSWTNWIASQCSPSTTTPVDQPSLATPAGYTLKDKIGQLLFVGVSDDAQATSLESQYQIGGILLNTGSSFSKSAIDSIKSAGKLPAFVAVDEEGGQVERLKGVIGSYPSAKSLGSMSADDVTAKAKDMGDKMGALGISVNFAPVTDLDDGHNTAISTTDRAFSSDPDTVATKAGAFATGLKQAGLIATFKHFPGLGHAKGSTGGNTDTGTATTPSLSNLKDNDLKPYTKILSSTQQTMVMMGNQTVPGLTDGAPASMSKAAYDLLRGDYGFSGVIVTDEIGSAKSITLSPSQAVIQALKSGADMPLFNATSTSQVGSIINDVAQAVDAGTLSEDSIDASVDKILQLKSKNQTPTASPEDIGGTCACPSSGDSTLVGNDHVEQAFNFFTSPPQNLTAFQAAVIVGVLMEESGKTLDTNAENSLTHAYGIAQWLGTRLDGPGSVKAFAQSEGKPVDDFATQLKFVWKELSGGHKSSLDKLKGQTDISTAVYDFEATYEGSGHMLIPQRINDAKFVLLHYGNSDSAPDPTAPSAPSATGCNSDAIPPTGEDAELTKTTTVSTPGKFITLPSKYSCPGHTTKIDSRIAADIAYLVDHYNLCANDGLASGHLSHGAGVAVDMVPKNGNDKDAWKTSAEAAARAMGWWGDGANASKGSTHSCANYGSGDYGTCMHKVYPDKFPQWLRWLGYNGAYCHGDPWHVYGGCGAHIHIGWDTPNNDGTSSTIISKPRDAVYAFPAPVPDDLKNLID